MAAAAAPSSSPSDASDRVTNSNSQRPSYVGLSKAVSGYSAFNRYDDDGAGEGGYSRRKKSSLGIGPNQIPVANEPQTLDHSEVIGLRSHHPDMRQITTHVVTSSATSNGHDTTDRAATTNNSSYSFVSSSSSVKYHYSSPNSRGDSPMSSEKTLSPESNSAGNLVQKQIERLYGNSSRTASTEDERIITSPINGNGEQHNNSSSNSSTPQRKNSGGFFAKRFGLSRQKDRHTANDSKILEERDAQARNNNGGPLEVKQLKVPAVFRLLRPEFREQLKSSSCQIPGDQTTTPSPTKKKITPPSSGATVARESVVASKERVIPIQRSDGNVVKLTNGGSSSENNDAIPVSSRLVQQDLTTPKRGSTERVIPIAVSPPKPKERVIPIQRSPERLLDSITPKSEEVKPKEEESSNNLLSNSSSHEVTSAALVASTMKERNNGASIPEVEEEEEEVAEEEVEDPYEGVGGVHECAPVLTTIMEEDEKSTAGSQLNLKAASRQTSQVDEVSKVEQGQEVKDGHYFIRLIENEIFKFEEQICDLEEDLSSAESGSASIPDDVKDAIHAAIGKAKLLMAQKLAQFRGLCDKNITVTVEEDPFVPTPQDLAGFWDMVYIQVEHIHALFAELAQLRSNGWKSKEANGTGLALSTSIMSNPSPKSTSSSSSNNSPANGNDKKPVRKSRTPNSISKTSTPKSGEKSEAAKARDAARKKMLEEKKRQMRERKQQQQQDNNGDIFVQF